MLWHSCSIIAITALNFCNGANFLSQFLTRSRANIMLIGFNRLSNILWHQCRDSLETVEYLGAVEAFEVWTKVLSDAQVNGYEADDCCLSHTTLSVFKTLQRQTIHKNPATPDHSQEPCNARPFTRTLQRNPATPDHSQEPCNARPFTRTLQRQTIHKNPATPDHSQEPCNARPCLLYTSPSPRDRQKSRMPSSA